MKEERFAESANKLNRNMNHLPANLVILRENLGISQAELAEKVGSNRGAVAQWELGNNMPREVKITKLAKLANVTVDELINTPLRLHGTIKFSPDTKIQLRVPGKGKIFKGVLDGNENILDSARTKHILTGGELNMASVITMSITDLLLLQKQQSDPETIKALQEVISFKRECEFKQTQIDMLMSQLNDKERMLTDKERIISSRDQLIEVYQQQRK